jgi:hypothetical protein
MRDKRFVAVHRGGSLTKKNHRKLIRWARECSEHVLPLVENVDQRLIHALNVAKDWENENAATGDAMKASLGAHAAARKYTNPVSIAVSRSIGHAVATAHMADHSLGAALYALKSVKLAGKSVDKEREWQNKKLQKLPVEIMELVHAIMTIKEKSFKM